MAKKLVVLSFDALQTNDLALLSTLPYFSALLKRAAVVRNVREIYPTLTYPIHTTLITGMHPDRHGIPHNQKASISPDDPDFSIMGSDWYWEKESIRVPTLVDAVIADGGSVATVLWPVTAGETRGYNIPEIWPVRGRGQDPRAVYEKAASANVMEEYYDRYISHYNWVNNEDMMYYGVELALEILREKKPDLLLCHVVHLDHVRHVYGDEGREVNECLRELDIIAGRFLRAAREAGTLDETNFVILGDHGQIDISNVFHLNAALREHGLIRTDESGLVAGYDAYGFSAGFSAQVMLRDPQDAAMRETVHAVLLALQEQYGMYIERVYTAEQVRAEEGLGGGFSFVLEGTEGTLFLNAPDAPLIVPFGSPEYKSYRAMHGHHPAKGNKPPFIAFGPDIAPVTLDAGDMLDICPTLAKLSRVELADMEGKPFPIFKNE